MKTATVQQLPQQWPEILRWVAAGEEVQVTQQDKVVARVVPARAAPRPDFLARAKAIWGEQPPGNPLSELILEARGGEPGPISREFISTDARQKKLATAMGLNLVTF